ncbi:Monoterepene synthase TPS1, chloropastic [Dirofilaria immitis]
MILPQVHLRKPCYDFCPVQATAIKAVSTKEFPPRKTFLANAFAVVRLATVQEFHLSRSDTNAPVRPS